MHLPHLGHAAVSAIWGVLLGLYVVVGLLAVELGLRTAVIAGCVAASGIFLYVRVYGGEPPGRS